jgi:hypothetical protein
MQKVALNLVGLALLSLLAFALLKRCSPDQRIARCEVFTEHLVGDPFADERAFSLDPVGSIKANKWSNEILRELKASSGKVPQVPAVGVVATLHFIDERNTVVAEGRIYLPNGDLIFFEPRLVKLRLPEFNDRVLALMQSKAPEALASLEAKLKARGMSLDQLRR